MYLVELINAMSDIVEKTLTAYKSDFYDYDLETLLDTRENTAFIWLVRDTGTYLLSNPYHIEAVIEQNMYIYIYSITRHGYDYTFKPLTKTDLRKWLDTEKCKYKYAVYYLASDNIHSRYKTLKDAENVCNGLNDGKNWNDNGVYMYSVKEV